MAPNRKKKKKPASNPARGFTTVSVPSKSNARSDEDSVKAEDISSDTAKPEAPKAASAAQSEETRDTESLAKLSPEELERHLEEAELQTILEKYAAKCKNEASRNAGKLETERRTLRAQGESLNLRDWLSPESCSLIFKKELRENEKLPSYLTRLEEDEEETANEEELLAKLWTQKEILLNLGFSDSRVNEALREALLHSSGDSVASKDFTWILNQAFEWLALHCPEDELPTYSQVKTAAKLDDQTGAHWLVYQQDILSADGR